MNIGTEKQKYVEDLPTAAEKAVTEGNMNQRYNTTNRLVGKYSNPERTVKDKEGKSVSELPKTENIWVELMKELLNNPAPLNPTDIEVAHSDLPIDVTP
ncbi:unnamed protein product [Schistosoma margrebowiei]|uniref:Uncharacterized protein n=1 Tax=Schistosoma margrebowiei TaxID=48269 RepID=A0A183M4R2_9TREM|nr:unnamed protein product [Schistosoma margrebowiei]